MRIIIVTGKGGVGKTSIAAATGMRCSKLGQKTLVMSTDSAHSLGDSFDFKLGAEPVKVAENLYGQEVDARNELLKQWGNIKSFISSTLQARGVESVVAEEISVFPGMEELFSLLLLKKYYQENEYDTVILDCAPTYSTIRLLSFPEVAQWYLRKIFPIQRHVAKIARPIAKTVYDVNIPGDGVFEDIKSFIMSMEGIKEVLTDPQITTIRFVINLERMVIREAQRTFTYMNLFGYNVDAVYINRIFPPEVDDSYLEKWKEIQKNYMKYVEESFSPLHLFKAKLFGDEMLGMDSLDKFGSFIYGEEDPSGIFCENKPMTIEENNGDFILKWRVPGVEKKDIDLMVRGEDLILNTPRYMRNMVMPSVLIGKSISGAKFEEGYLNIKFSDSKEDKD